MAERFGAKFNFDKKSIDIAQPKQLFTSEELSPTKTRGNLSAMLDEKEREDYIKQQSIDVFMDFLRRDGASSSKECPELEHKIADK